jgi:hypothetical protein
MNFLKRFLGFRPTSAPTPPQQAKAASEPLTPSLAQGLGALGQNLRGKMAQLERDDEESDKRAREVMLWEFIGNGDVEKVKMVLGFGVDVNAKDKDGWTPLMWAAVKGHENCVSALISGGASVNAKSSDGWTALLLSAKKGHVACARTLIGAGADATAKNKDGNIALALTSSDELAAVLRSAAREVDVSASSPANSNSSVSSRLCAPKPSRIYVAGNGFVPEREDIILGVRGFFARHENLERDLPPGVEMEGFFAFGADAAQFCEVAIATIFEDGKHRGAYYLDAVLLPSDGRQQMMAVFLW